MSPLNVLHFGKCHPALMVMVDISRYVMQLLWPCILGQTGSVFRHLSKVQPLFSKNIHGIVIIFTIAIDFKQPYPKGKQSVSSENKV